MEELSASPEKSFSRSYVLSKNYIVAGERRLDWWIKERHARTASKRASSPGRLSESLLLPLLPPRQLPPGAQETFRGTPRLKRSLVATTKRWSDIKILKFVQNFLARLGGRLPKKSTATMTNRWVVPALPVVDLDQCNNNLKSIKRQTDPYAD